MANPGLAQGLTAGVDEALGVQRNSFRDCTTHSFIAVVAVYILFSLIFAHPSSRALATSGRLWLKNRHVHLTSRYKTDYSQRPSMCSADSSLTTHFQLRDAIDSEERPFLPESFCISIAISQTFSVCNHHGYNSGIVTKAGSL